MFKHIFAAVGQDEFDVIRAMVGNFNRGVILTP